MDQNDIDNRFTYHSPTQSQIIRYGALREQARIFAHMIVAATPVCREQSLAITALEDCVYRANAAIARHEASESRELPVELNKLAEDYRKAIYQDAAARSLPQEQPLPEWVQQLMTADTSQEREWKLIQQATQGGNQVPLAGTSGGVAGSGIMPVFPAFEEPTLPFGTLRDVPLRKAPYASFTDNENATSTYSLTEGEPGEGYQAETVEKD